MAAEVPGRAVDLSTDGAFSLGESETAGRPGTQDRAGSARRQNSSQSEPRALPEWPSCRVAALNSALPTRNPTKWAVFTLRGLIWKCEEGWTLTNIDPVITLIDREKAGLTHIQVSKLSASKLQEKGNFLNLTKYIFKN